MRKGKMVAQGAHASMKVLLNLMERNIVVKEPAGYAHKYSLEFFPDSALYQWLEGKFTKICLGCDSSDELLTLYHQALENNLPTSLIIDCGLTEFNNVPTLTAAAIGPAYSERIDQITGHLKLL